MFSFGYIKFWGMEHDARWDWIKEKESLGNTCSLGKMLQKSSGR